MEVPALMIRGTPYAVEKYRQPLQQPVDYVALADAGAVGGGLRLYRVSRDIPQGQRRSGADRRGALYVRPDRVPAGLAAFAGPRPRRGTEDRPRTARLADADFQTDALGFVPVHDCYAGPGLVGRQCARAFGAVLRRRAAGADGRGPGFCQGNQGLA